MITGRGFLTEISIAEQIHGFAGTHLQPELCRVEIVDALVPGLVVVLTVSPGPAQLAVLRGTVLSTLSGAGFLYYPRTLPFWSS